jgi:hypothetical protein
MSNEEKIVGYPFTIDVRVALLESSIASINQTLLRIETNTTAQLSELKYEMNKRFDDSKSDTNRQFDDIKSSIDGLKKDCKSDFRWILTIISGVVGIMAHGFHWI